MSILKWSSDFCEALWVNSRPRGPHGLRRGSAAAPRVGLRVRIPLGAWVPVCCECRILSGSLSDGPITRPAESYRTWCVWMWFRNPTMKTPRPTRVVEPCSKKNNYKYIMYGNDLRHRSPTRNPGCGMRPAASFANYVCTTEVTQNPDG